MGALAALSLLGLGLDGTAQSLPEGSAVPNTDGAPKIYLPEFFVVFQPQTARDMISRLPGFTLQGGSGGRGFGQASLNLLINGQRPSSKSSDASEILGRISFETVVRIELLDGAALDIPGLSGQVANIVTQSNKMTGNWEYAARFEEGTEPQITEGKVSLSGSRGSLDYVASFEADIFTFSEKGRETFFDRSGRSFETRREAIDYEQVNPALDLNLTWTPKADHIVNLNLGYDGFGNSNFNISETLTASLDPGRDGQTLFASGEDEVSYEIGGDYSRPFSIGTLKLIGLHRYESSESSDRYREFIVNETPYDSRFLRDAVEGETIARTEFSWKQGAKQDWQISLEGAFNSLDDTSGFEDNFTEFAPENVRVEEERAEGFITHGWALSKNLNLQSAVGAEYSRLEVTTSNDPARTFIRPKGSVTASYTLSPRYTVRSKIERAVDQLNFFDFVSSVSLTENTANGGNTKIVPPQFWNAEIELERKDDKVLSGTVEAALRIIDDPIDRIPLLLGGEGPGNLDRATEVSSHVNLTYLMDHIGLKGVQLQASGGVHFTKLDDPVTGQTRDFNSQTLWHINGTLIHDIPNTPYAWSLYLEKFKEAKFFRLDQSFDNRFDAPFSNISVTHKSLLGMRVSLGLSNFFTYNQERRRVLFDGDRNGPVIGSEFRTRSRGRRISLTVEDTF